MDDGTPTIYIAADTEHNFAISLISQHLADYFGSPNLRSDIALILSTPEHHLDELFKVMLEVPDLPKSWTEKFEADSPPPYLVPDPQQPFVAQIEVASSERPAKEMSAKEAEDIISLIKGTILEDEQADAFETSDAEAFTYDANKLIETMSSLTLSQLKAHRHSSTSSISDARLIGDDDYEEEIKGRNIRSGFAGEFFVRPAFA